MGRWGTVAAALVGGVVLLGGTAVVLGDDALTDLDAAAVVSDEPYAFSELLEDGSGRPLAYDPCRPLRYVVNREAEPAGGDAALDRAFAEVAAAAGLTIERGPDTDEVYADPRDAVQPDRYGPDFAPVLVDWATEDEVPDLAGETIGLGGSQAQGWDEPETLRYVTGEVVLDVDDVTDVLEEGGGEAELHSVVMHELMHVLGLDHVSDADEVMHPEATDQDGLGPGDRDGLRALASATCFTDWAELAAAQ